MDAALVVASARSEAEARVSQLEKELADIVAASEADNADDEHDPEGATIAFERAAVIGLLKGARERVARLDAAHTRVVAGTFGRCVSCGGQLPQERLLARPDALHCVRCASLRT